MDRNTTQETSPSEEVSFRKVFLAPKKTSKFCSNKVETAKYTPITWLPKSIILQFSRVNNVYFLVLTILCFFPFSPYFPWSYAGYFIFILLFTSIKDGIEDISRHQQDKKVNKALVKKYNSIKKSFEDIVCEDLKVGDIVKIEENQSFPADLVFLSSSMTEGVCYVNTMNLDGETNLKEKVKVEISESLDDMLASDTEFLIEQPRRNLYRLNGKMICAGRSEVLSIKQILLRGCTLKNTEWIVGVIVYTGRECKVVMNGQNRISKISSHQKSVNKIVLTVIGVLVVVCFAFAVAGQSWLNTNSEIEAYLELENTNDAVSGVYIFFTYWIMFSALIPLSLYLFIEVQRLIISSFVSKDIEMYHEESDLAATWRTSDVVEELGRIEYIFSDKTGTLTSNQMKLEKIYVDHTVYSVNQDISSIQTSFSSNNSFELLFLNILLCNSVFPTVHNNKRVYHSVSPDETALVDFATMMGFGIMDKKKDSVKIYMGVEQDWIIKTEISFSSERKRMSVVAQGPDGELKLFLKGADEVVIPMVSRDDFERVTGVVGVFAKEGLRTLVLATRSINKSWFKDWNKKWKAALKRTDDAKQLELDLLASEIEKDLNFSAITAIEDKLQDKVPETIEMLIKADIKVWMITGDKEETAIEIGKSCNLITSETELISFFDLDLLKIEDKLKSILDKYNIPSSYSSKHKLPPLPYPHSIAINGMSLSYLKSSESACDSFFVLSSLCKSVICCRMSPAQKSEIVKIVKNRGTWITLAIGDGANDVSMLKEASVGVGVFGKEGTQAILASDFAISQFSHLQRLLFVHGRYAYSRISTFTLYYFYTDYVLQICEIWLAFFTGFSGQIYYLDWIPSTYNIFVMSLPTMASFATDRDITPSLCLKYLNLYSAGQKGAFFNLKLYWTWIFWTVIGGTICFWVSMGSLTNGVGSDGRDAGLFWCSSLSYILLVAAVNWKLLFTTRSWNYIYG